MPSRHPNARTLAVLLACGLSFAEPGCSRKTVHAVAPVASTPAPASERPMPLAPDTNASPPEDAPATAPVIPAATTTPRPVTIPQTKPAPAPHKPSTAQSEQTSEQPAHPPAPQISLQISPGDQASYERKANEDISVAERDLQQASGKQLNAAQQDLVEKIRSFLNQSREASKGGDWARAQNLAQKARLLSDELVNSL